MYTLAVQRAQELLASGVYNQDQVDSALADILTQKDALRAVETVGGVECFISGLFKTSKVNVGKTATMAISVIKGRDVVDFEIYNEAGTMIEITRQTVSRTKSDRDNWTIVIKPTNAEAGSEPQKYTVYAVLGDGTRSADYLEMSILVIGR